MPKVLHLFDVSPFIHAGHVNKYSFLEQIIDVGTTWKSQRTPTGGFSLLLNTLCDLNGQNDDFVFCCDRNPTIKKDMLPTYKSNRSHNSDISVENAAAEYLLEQCNCTVLARAGYEADDLIYTLTKELYDAYDEINIYTGDSDLYFLVDEKVSIKPSSSKSKTVYRSTYEKTPVHGKLYRYNTITLSKIVKGDSSDCIPALPMDIQNKIVKNLYREELYAHYGDYKIVRGWMEMLVPEAVAQVDLVFPLKVDGLPDMFKKPDRDMLRNFGDAVHNKNYKRMGDPNFDVKPFVYAMQALGIYIEEVN